MTVPPSSPNRPFAREVTRFSAASRKAPASLFRHPGLDPGSILPAPRGRARDHMRGEEGLHAAPQPRIANEVRQFYGLFR